MARRTEEWNRLANETAARVRLAVADLPRSSSEERQRVATSILDETLRDLEPAERPAMLEAVRGHFPTLETGRLRDEVEHAASTSRADQERLRDWSFLCERLAELVPDLDPTERQAVRARLAGVGLLGREDPAAAATDEQVRDVRQVLGVRRGEEVDPERLVQLVDLLVDFTVNSERVLRDFYKEIDPTRKDLRSYPLRETLRKYLSGDVATTRTQCGDALRQARSLFKVLKAVKEGLTDWSTEFSRRWGPEQIKQNVGQRGGLVRRPEVDWWNQYSSLAEKHLVPDKLAEDVRSKFAEAARVNVSSLR